MIVRGLTGRWGLFDVALTVPVLRVTMDSKDIEQLIKWLGIPGALLAIFIWLTSKGYILWAREFREVIKLKDSAIQDLKERLESMKTEKNFWRQIALGGQEELERATRTVEKAVEKLPHRPLLPPEGDG